MNNINHNDEHLKIIKLEGELLIIFIISLGISLILNHNSKLQNTNQQTIWTNEESKLIAIANAMVVVAATLGELFLILKDRELVLESNGSFKKLEILSIEVFIGVVAVIISLIEVYVAINSDSDDPFVI